MAIKGWKYSVPGIPDEMFARGRIPMTKEEVRSVVLSKLMLRRDSRVLDIGAGTGSISVEAALIAREGKVYSVEKDREAVSLIKQNLKLFEISNCSVKEGRAPEVLSGLEQVDRVFVGGSSGRMEDILEACVLLMACGGIMVVNCLTLESFFRAYKWFKNSGEFDIDVVQMSIARVEPVGSYSMFKPLNPVFILRGIKEGEKL